MIKCEHFWTCTPEMYPRTHLLRFLNTPLSPQCSLFVPNTRCSDGMAVIVVAMAAVVAAAVVVAAVVDDAVMNESVTICTATEKRVVAASSEKSSTTLPTRGISANTVDPWMNWRSRNRLRWVESSSKPTRFRAAFSLLTPRKSPVFTRNPSPLT